MTASRLAALLNQATKGEWEAWEDEFGWHVSGRSEDVTGSLARDQEIDARLIALAPDMARLLVDMADALRYPGSGQCGKDEDELDGREHVRCFTCDCNALLARFAALDEKAGGA